MNLDNNYNSIEEIDKIFQILLSNQNKINFLRNSPDRNTNNGMNKFLNGLEIDIKNILSLLDRIKFDISQNMNKDIIICGNCDCCKLCNCSTNNCSENPINLSNDNIPKNEYIKEIINQEEKINNDLNLPFNNNLANYKTYQYLNPNYNSIENNPIEDRYKKSAVMKSKRFNINKSFDNLNRNQASPIRKAKIIRHYNLTEANNNINYNNKRITKCQKFLNKLNNQPKEIINRFKNIYGNDIEQKLMNNEINNKDLNEMDNILNKIINMSIWGKDEKKSKEKNKKRMRFNYNPIQEKIKLKQALSNKQAIYKEYPRGWNSTKEYFINNGTAINNDNAFI